MLLKIRGARRDWSRSLFVLAGLSTPAFSAPYVLQWDPVNDNRVSSYTVYYGEAPHNYTQAVDVGNSTTFTTPDLNLINPGAIYYFAVKANNGTTDASALSSETTSGTFRYAFGMGADPNGAHQLEVLNMNQVPEQTVATGWSEYNILSGETRVATGDIDGDGRDEVVLGLAPVGQPGLPDGWFEILDDDFSHLAWGQVNWSDYNLANGETRPAVGDIDGDGKAEIFIGLGSGGSGLIEIFRFANGAVAPVGWSDINLPAYSQANGETWPALGDVDGDGRAELAIGMGSGGAGVLLLKKGFDEARLGAGYDPWLDEVQGDLTFAQYASQSGEIRPAFGDFDGDAAQEIVVGLGPGGNGDLEIFKYVSHSLVAIGAIAVNFPMYNALNGETRPATGDIDGDQRAEIIVGLGAGGNGRAELFDDALTQFSYSGSVQLGTSTYAVANGALWPALKRERVIPAPPAPVGTGTGAGSGSSYVVGTTILAPNSTVATGGQPPAVAIRQYTLTTNQTGTGNGTVGGGGRYAVGSIVTPSALAATGSTFTGWSPSTCGAAFTLTADATCTATFTINNYALTVSKAGTGSGTVSGGGRYPAGTTVTPTALAATGSILSGWSPTTCGSAFALTADATCTATFTPSYNLTATSSGSGTVTSSPVGISCGADCTEPYAVSTAVALKASPAAGFSFSGWSGACTGTGNCSVTMSAAKSVTATFKAIPTYSLTIKFSGPANAGTVTSTPAGISCGSTCTQVYASGTVVTLTAKPTNGRTFSGWSGACTGKASCAVTMSATSSVKATFK